MNKIGLGIIVVALTASIALAVYTYVQSPRIGYVRSQELINRYAGTIEARQNFEKTKSVLQSNVDSLQMRFEQSRSDYFSKAARMSASQRNTTEQALSQQQSQLMQYASVIEDKIQEEDEKMMGAVLNQINSFVESYAEANDFDIIMGTTLSGSLLYGKKSMDLTEEILGRLNEKYKGK